MSSFSNTPNFDNLLLQTLMSRLHLHRPPNTTATATATATSSLNQTLEDLLLSTLSENLSEDEESPDNDKTQLAKEEIRLEKSIIKTIVSGDVETLKPNSGQAVTINDHHVCVGYHQEGEEGYRVWEWHGHIMLFDDENGYSPEYIYGNYFERVRDGGGVQVRGGGEERETETEEEEVEEEEEEKFGSLGLRELIGLGDESGTGRILHRGLNVGSPRF